MGISLMQSFPATREHVITTPVFIGRSWAVSQTPAYPETHQVRTQKTASGSNGPDWKAEQVLLEVSGFSCV